MITLICIAYKGADETKIVRPDLIFLAEDDSKIVADIVDLYGFHLADALPKLNGLALRRNLFPDLPPN